MKVQNPNCDGGCCKSEAGEVRRFPIGGESCALLCKDCWENEKTYDAKATDWEDLYVYETRRTPSHPWIAQLASY